MKYLLLVLFVVAAIAGCAKSPDSIAPAYVSERAYDNLDCAQLVEEQMNVNAAFSVASQQQSDARTNDIVGVVLLGLPVSTLSGGNVAYQVADLKGQQVAIQRTMTRKRCSAATARAAGAVAAESRPAVAADPVIRPAGVRPLPTGPDVAEPVNYSPDEVLAFCRAGWETRRLADGTTEYNPCFYQ